MVERKVQEGRGDSHPLQQGRGLRGVDKMMMKNMEKALSSLTGQNSHQIHRFRELAPTADQEPYNPVNT
ncbi:hypothetical protein DPMN_042615 [Dreissena polymorpha]|uniref:Uncharacterized protein n=1 Tax=Dreissena polymorpha TaxID=45954 RepID=A0A9D4D139_DREPO|nr:hypothetical protein DPMN_042615 [Dreissena polymorpha]